MATEVGPKCPGCAATALPAARRAGLAALAGGVTLTVVAGLIGLRLLDGGTPSSRPPAPVGSWQRVPSPPGVQGGTTEVVLTDGRVLVAGGGSGAVPLASAAVYDPLTSRWSPAGSMRQARRGAAAVALADGRVLVAGGVAGGRALASAEVFDPATGSWTMVAPMPEPRAEHTLTRLADGGVLLAGGELEIGGDPTSAAALYTPSTGRWDMLPGMLSGRAAGSAVLLHDHRVLIAGGFGADGLALRAAEVFDPAGARFVAASPMAEGRAEHTATVLADGRVLVAGGSAHRDLLPERVGSPPPVGSNSSPRAELFDPVAAVWTSGGAMHQGRRLQAASPLRGGEVLVSGGESVDLGSRSSLVTAEVFDPGARSWRVAAAMACARSSPGQAILPSGAVLVVGGDTTVSSGVAPASDCAEVFRL